MTALFEKIAPPILAVCGVVMIADSVINGLDLPMLTGGALFILIAYMGRV
jgi:hypothetical protein